jgi:hypothetical protein
MHIVSAVIAHSAITWHLELNITGLLDMILRIEALCHCRRLRVKGLWPLRIVSAKYSDSPLWVKTSQWDIYKYPGNLSYLQFLFFPLEDNSDFTILLGFLKMVTVRYSNLVRPKIKFCLFPLSDRPTKFAATQKILLPHLMKNYFFKICFSFVL